MALIPSSATVPVPGWEAAPVTPGWHNLVTAWERWDALWFLRIASEGYAVNDVSAAFFPLYPMLVGALGIAMGGHPLAAALLISNVAYLAAMVVVYRLTDFEFDQVVARRTVLYMTVFPTAFFFFAPYTESLFLLLVASSIYGARRDNWAVALGCGILATATRSVGLVLVPVLAIEAIRRFLGQPRDLRRLPTLLRNLAAAALVSCGTLAYFLYWEIRTGDGLRPITDQGGWQREFSWPWDTLRLAGEQGLEFIGSFPGGYHTIDVLLFLIALAACAWLFLHVRITYAAYVGLSLLAPLFLVFGGRQLMSVPRFILPMFPVFWAFAWLSERYRAHDAIVAVSAGGLGLMTALFATWYYVF